METIKDVDTAICTGVIRPVRYDPQTGQASAFGPRTAPARYRQLEPPERLVQVLDDVTLYGEPGADGTGLFDETGALVAWWQMLGVSGGDPVTISAGFGLPAAAAARGRAAAEASTHARA